jgi:hypothetical protein
MLVRLDLIAKQHKELTSSFDYAGPMTETVLMGNLAIRSYMLRKENSKGGFDFYARKKTAMGRRKHENN